VPRDKPDRAFAFGAVGGVLVIEGAELPARPATSRERDSARSLDALRLKRALDRIELGVSRELAVAVRLDVDLVELQLRRNTGEFALERRRVGEPLGAVDRDVNRRAKVPVRRRMRGLR